MLSPLLRFKNVLDCYEKAGSLFLTELIYLFARMVMADRPIFVQLMSATTLVQNTTETKLYEGLLDQWWSKVFLNLCLSQEISQSRPSVVRRHV